MPVLQISNLTANSLPVNSAIGKIPGSQTVTVNIKTCELEEIGEKLNALESAGLISWTPVKSADVDDKLEFVPISLEGGGCKWTVGTGSPEAAVVGSVGDLYSRLDGSTSTTLYVKTSGTATNTGWTAK